MTTIQNHGKRVHILRLLLTNFVVSKKGQAIFRWGNSSDNNYDTYLYFWILAFHVDKVKTNKTSLNNLKDSVERAQAMLMWQTTCTNLVQRGRHIDIGPLQLDKQVPERGLIICFRERLLTCNDCVVFILSH